MVAQAEVEVNAEVALQIKSPRLHDCACGYILDSDLQTILFHFFRDYLTMPHADQYQCATALPQRDYSTHYAKYAQSY